LLPTQGNHDCRSIFPSILIYLIYTPTIIIYIHTNTTQKNRLPRRYSDRHRDASAPIVGSSGSTPLHFAAANGHTSVVRTLLLHGAHADRADKHGVTPEMLARENGMETTADALREAVNKDRDLRERSGSGSGSGDEGISGSGGGKDKKPCGTAGALECLETSVRKRLHVKQSIDHALNTFKGHSHSDPHTHMLGLGGDTNSNMKKQPSPSEPASSLGEYTFYAAPKPDEEGSKEEDNSLSSSRRPSLPHIYNDLPLPPLPSPSTRTTRRPRSAGQDASSPTTEPSSAPRAPPRKLGSKYSLLNLFRKAGDNSPESPYVHSSWSFSTPPSASPSHTPIYMPLHPHLVWYWVYRLWAW